MQETAHLLLWWFFYELIFRPLGGIIITVFKNAIRKTKEMQ